MRLPAPVTKRDILTVTPAQAGIMKATAGALVTLQLKKHALVVPKLMSIAIKMHVQPISPVITVLAVRQPTAAPAMIYHPNPDVAFQIHHLPLGNPYFLMNVIQDAAKNMHAATGVAVTTQDIYIVIVQQVRINILSPVRI